MGGAGSAIANVERGDIMRVMAVMLGLLSAFFGFYTVRLLIVTRFLQALRAGGQGAYFGAVAFPLLALVFALASWRAWRRGSPR